MPGDFLALGMLQACLHRSNLARNLIYELGSHGSGIDLGILP